jgi:hypothetical protein
MKWLVSGNANEKWPCSGYRTFIPARDARIAPSTPGTIKERGRRFSNVWRSWRGLGALGENPV